MAVLEPQRVEMNIWQRMLNIDRRILYLLLWLTMSAVMLFVRGQMPDVITSPVKDLYQTIENLPPDKMVILSSNWGPGTIGENRPQLEAILEHLIRRRLKFAVVSFFEPQLSIMSYRYTSQITEKHGYEYGKDWVHFGFVPSIELGIKGMNESFVEAIKRDYKNTPIDQIEMMKNFRSMVDVSLVVDITPSGTVGAWISFVRKGTLVGYCPTSVMAAEGYTYLKSKQLVGMLTGAKGAYEYELLLKTSGYASRLINTITASHLLIVAAILFGNFCLLMARLTRKGEEQHA